MAPRLQACTTIGLAVTALAVAPRAAWGQRAIGSLMEMSTSALSLRDSVVALARAQIGRKYVYGGTSPRRGFDCSGLVRYVMRSLSVEVPRTAREQSKMGEPLPRDSADLLPGDVLLFGKANGGVSHVGIYVGNGRYVHASSIAGRVIESPLDRPPSALVKVLKSARRLLALDAMPANVAPSAPGVTVATGVSRPRP